MTIIWHWCFVLFSNFISYIERDQRTVSLHFLLLTPQYYSPATPLQESDLLHAHTQVWHRPLTANSISSHNFCQSMNNKNSLSEANMESTPIELSTSINTDLTFYNPNIEDPPVTNLNAPCMVAISTHRPHSPKHVTANFPLPSPIKVVHPTSFSPKPMLVDSPHHPSSPHIEGSPHSSSNSSNPSDQNDPDLTLHSNPHYQDSPPHQPPLAPHLRGSPSRSPLSPPFSSQGPPPRHNSAQPAFVSSSASLSSLCHCRIHFCFNRTRCGSGRRRWWRKPLHAPPSSPSNPPATPSSSAAPSPRHPLPLPNSSSHRSS